MKAFKCNEERYPWKRKNTNVLVCVNPVITDRAIIRDFCLSLDFIKTKYMKVKNDINKSKRASFLEDSLSNYKWEAHSVYGWDIDNTSSHSVAPTAPKSPPLQLAKTMLLLGLNWPKRQQKVSSILGKVTGQ